MSAFTTSSSDVQSTSMFTRPSSLAIIPSKPGATHNRPWVCGTVPSVDQVKPFAVQEINSFTAIMNKGHLPCVFGLQGMRMKEGDGTIEVFLWHNKLFKDCPNNIVIVPAPQGLTRMIKNKSLKTPCWISVTAVKRKNSEDSHYFTFEQIPLSSEKARTLPFVLQMQGRGAYICCK